jgi:hypothetical protein
VGAVSVAHVREIRNSYIIFVGKPKWKRPFEKRGRKWKDANIKTSFKEIVVRAWTGFIWLRMGSGGGVLSTH